MRKAGFSKCERGARSSGVQQAAGCMIVELAEKSALVCESGKGQPVGCIDSHAIG